MIRRPPRSTLFPYHDALPIWTFRQTALLRRGPRTHVGSRTRPPREEFTMGPFPHDAPAARITPQNPAGTDGFEFVEYAHPEPSSLHALFRTMGFTPVARHRGKAVTLYRQGDVNYLVNEEPGGHAARFAAAHGPCAPAMAFRVADARDRKSVV